VCVDMVLVREGLWMLDVYLQGKQMLFTVALKFLNSLVSFSVIWQDAMTSSMQQSVPLLEYLRKRFATSGLVAWE
jgi:hypothetical protein